jgi:iron complex transport system permease protein
MSARSESRHILLLVCLLLLIVVLAITDIVAGRVAVDLGKALQDLAASRESIESIIVWDIRLPRVLLAIMVGATLAMCGAAMQGLLQNPLASPDLLGVGTAAALGAVIVLYFGIAHLAWFLLPLGGLVGAMIATALIFFLAGRDSSVLHLVLSGVAISALVGSLISLALNLAPNPYAASEIVFWLLGSLENRSYHDVVIALPFMIVCVLLLWVCRRFLDALSLGDDTATTLGFNVPLMRVLLVTGVAAGVGAAVSVSGSIGFIGLVVPHMLRPFVGHQPGRLLVASALAGAAMLLGADIAVKLVASSVELKLGVVTSLVGGPFFLYLIYRLRSEYQ